MLGPASCPDRSSGSARVAIRAAAGRAAYRARVADSMRCCKPGCGAPTAARLTYDHAGATAWVDDPGGDGGWALCARHADRLGLPKGWTLVDRRAPRGTRTLLAS